MLAIGAYDNVALIDLARMEEVARLGGPQNYPLAFEPAGDALLTYGWSGLLRWPLRTGEAAGSLTVGLPTRLMATTQPGWWGCSPDGRTIAVPRFSEGALVWQSSDGRSTRLGPQADVRHCALSPDGPLGLHGSFGADERTAAKVWNAVTGEHAADLTTGGFCKGWFSPDGKWLVTNGGGHRVWEVGTWKEGPSLGAPGLPRCCAFTPDSKLMALDAEPGVVRLVDPATGREVARLTAPEQTRLCPHCFTPDGGQLIAVGGETQAVHVFDLRAIRAGLREIGLDWSDDPLPPATAKPEPLRVTIENGPTRDRVEAQRLDDLARGHIGKKEYVAALTLLRQAVRSDPDFALAHNNLAWVLVAGPVKLRDAKEALLVAERAVKLAPDEWFYLNTLGVAQYRNGLHKEAVLTLEKSLSRSRGEFDAFDLFFLAMCHAKLGDGAKANDCLDRAVKAVEAKKNLAPQHAEELKAFRAEAEEALRKE